MDLGNILSYLERIANSVENNEGKKNDILKNFTKDLGISEERREKVRSLIDAYEDQEENIKDYNKDVNECDNTINKLNDSLSKLEANLVEINKKEKSGKRGKKTDDEIEKDRERVQGLIDEKKEKIAKEKAKREVIDERRDRAKKAQRSTERKLKKEGVTDIAKAKKSAKKMDAELAGLGKEQTLGQKIAKLAKNPYVIAIEYFIKAVEWGIGKATEYTKLSYENTMRAMNATTTVTLNQMKVGLSSWEDSVNGAYSAQSMAIDSQLAVMEAANATALANMKLQHTWTNWVPILGALNKAQEELLQVEQELMKTDLENAKKRIDQTGEYAKKTDDYIKKQDNAVHAFQVTTGLSSQQTAEFEKRMFSMGEEFAKFGKTIEDALKMQSQYAEQSGRAVNFSDEEYTKNFAVGRLVGEDNLMNFEAQMNIFNQSVSDSADIMYDMYRDANRMGISQKKLVKDVLGNLKLANKYDFKNGTKGFIELAKWAENARFNLSSLGGALEKVQGGGLEGVIKQSAGLQVLGGQFAMGSNPLSMMFNAYQDPEEYAKNIQKMFSTMGTFNSETGETTFGTQEQIMIRSAAEQLGISVEDAKNMARGARQKDVVKRQMTGSMLKTEDQDAIANKAKYDKETGEWYVDMIGGGRKNVGDITEGDLNKVLSDNKEENAEKYAQGTLSAVETIQATTARIASLLGDSTFEDFMNTTKKANENTLEAFTSNIGNVSEAIGMYRENALQQQGKMLEDLGNIKDNLVRDFATVAKYEQWVEQKLKEMRDLLDHNKTNIENAEENVKEKAEQHSEAKTKGERIKAGQELVSAKAKLYEETAKAEESKPSVWSQIKAFLIKGAAVYQQTEGRKQQLELDGWGLPSEVTPNKNKTKDGVSSGNGKPMVVGASEITPVQDGHIKLAKTDPKDSAVFAKTGGPFDTLFNGIFAKINELHGMFTGNSGTINNRYGNSITSFLNKSFLSPTSFMERSGGAASKLFGGILPSRSVYQSPMSIDAPIADARVGRDKPSRMSSDMHLTIDGKLELAGQNGQAINIIDELRSNPMFVRQITEMIVLQMNNNTNGGRNELFHNRFSG